MEKDIVKHLSSYYYAMLILAVVEATAAYYLVTKGIICPIAPNSTWGVVIQSFVILDALLTIPLGLYMFKRRCLKISKIEDTVEQAAAYEVAARWRIILVSNTMGFALIACYLLGGYTSMLWVAAISAIGWYFTKPTEKKMFLELHTSEEEQY